MLYRQAAEEGRELTPEEKEFAQQQWMDWCNASAEKWRAEDQARQAEREASARKQQMPAVITSPTEGTSQTNLPTKSSERVSTSEARVPMAHSMPGAGRDEGSFWSAAWYRRWLPPDRNGAI